MFELDAEDFGLGPGCLSLGKQRGGEGGEAEGVASRHDLVFPIVLRAAGANEEARPMSSTGRHSDGRGVNGLRDHIGLHGGPRVNVRHGHLYNVDCGCGGEPGGQEKCQHSLTLLY